MDESEDSETVLCTTPKIDVKKTAETQVSNAGIIHYCITVKNPGTVGLENVKVTDDLCSSAKYHGNATVTPVSAPAIGQSGNIVWNLGTLAPGQTKTIRFEAKASIDCGTVGPCDRHCDGDGDGKCDRCHSSCSVRCGGCTRHCDGNWDNRCDRCNSYCTVRCGYSNPCSSHCDNNGDSRCDRCNSSCTVRCGGCDRHCDGNYNGNCDRCGQPTSVRCGSTSCSQCSNYKYCTNTVCATGDCEGSNGLSRVSDTDNWVTKIVCAGGPGCGYDRVGADPTLTTDLPLEVTPGVELYRALPNPFSSSTSFSYEVRGDASPVEIMVYDVAGRRIAKLVDEVRSAGRHSVVWDGRSDEGVPVGRGIYFIRTTIAGIKENQQRVIYLR
jgi:uncharacterized repeat protein (TIGR01451 family)